jgi:hypothetical protein
MEQIRRATQLIPNEYYLIKLWYTGLKLLTRFQDRRVLQDDTRVVCFYFVREYLSNISLRCRSPDSLDRLSDEVFIELDWHFSFGGTEIFRSRVYDILIKHILLKHLSCAHSHVSALIREFI